jgi:hypothetical protein
MPENSSDDAVLLDEGQNPHLGSAIGAAQRVGVPDLGDEPPPLAEVGATIRLMALSRVFGMRRARLGTNAPSLVGIPTVVAHELTSKRM